MVQYVQLPLTIVLVETKITGMDMRHWFKFWNPGMESQWAIVHSGDFSRETILIDTDFI